MTDSPNDNQLTFEKLYDALQRTGHGWMCSKNEVSARPGKHLLKECDWSHKYVTELGNFIGELCSHSESASTKVNWTLWCKTMVIEGIGEGLFPLPDSWELVKHRNGKCELWINGTRFAPPLQNSSRGETPVEGKPRPRLDDLVSLLEELSRLQCRKMQLETELIAVNGKMKTIGSDIPGSAKKALKWLAVSYPTLRPILSA